MELLIYTCAVIPRRQFSPPRVSSSHFLFVVLVLTAFVLFVLFFVFFSFRESAVREWAECKDEPPNEVRQRLLRSATVEKYPRRVAFR